MEQTRHKQTACTNQQSEEWARLIRKLRWIGMDEEAHHLQMAMCTPESGHVRCTSSCLLCANSGRCYSFDHLVGNEQKIATYCQAQCFRRLQIDDQLEFGRSLYGQLRRLRPFEDFLQINSSRSG